jgi:hypothetical protein
VIAPRKALQRRLFTRLSPFAQAAAGGYAFFFSKRLSLPRLPRNYEPNVRLSPWVESCRRGYAFIFSKRLPLPWANLLRRYGESHRKSYSLDLRPPRPPPPLPSSAQFFRLRLALPN